MDRPTELRRIALAVEGPARGLEDDRLEDDRLEALAELLESDGDGTIARRHRAAPTLAMLCRRHGLEGPALPSWRRQLMEVAAHHMVLDEALGRTARTLHDAGVAWIPLKGLDLSTRVYDQREERPTSDLDLLIAPEDLDRARQALLAKGVVPLADDPRVERYLQEEGYAWQASDPRGGLIELHFRLWGSAPESLARVCFDAADDDPTLPPGGRRLPLEHAFVVGAVHAWLDGPPRGLHPWRDLLRIGRTGPPGLAERIIELAAELGLELPVGLAARAAAGLWNEEPEEGDTCTLVAHALEDRLRLPERRFARRWCTDDRVVDAPLASQVVARRLSGRPMRHGLGRLIWRRIWPHAGVVAASTDIAWSWTLRRLWYQCRVVFAAEGLSDRIAAFAHRRARGNAPPAEESP